MTTVGYDSTVLRVVVPRIQPEVPSTIHRRPSLSLLIVLKKKAERSQRVAAPGSCGAWLLPDLAAPSERQVAVGVRDHEMTFAKASAPRPMCLCLGALLVLDHPAVFCPQARTGCHD